MNRKKENGRKITSVEQLGLFVRKAKELRNRSCFAFLTTYKSSITIKMSSSIAPMDVSNLVKPEEESYRSYLISFRQFLLTESDIEVGKILNMSANRARHIAFRNQFLLSKDEWKDVNEYLHGIYRDTENGGKESIYTGEELFKKWVNGTKFHPDIDAEDFFASLGKLVEPTEVNFAKYVGLCSNFILHVAGVIETGLYTNGFDLLNEFSTLIRANYVVEITDKTEKENIARFQNGTKSFPQNLWICDEHDQNTVIEVKGFDVVKTDLPDIIVEVKSCCENAANIARAIIQEHEAYMEYVKKHGMPPSRKIDISEMRITDLNDIQNIKTALKDYHLIWRRTVGNMRCDVHNMPPGARAFGIDLYHQRTRDEPNAVYLQGCCQTFMEQVIEKLRLLQQ